jgi:hypothetical protein
MTRDIPNTFLTQLAKEIDKILKKNKEIQFSKKVFSEALDKLRKRKSIKMTTWVIVLSQIKYLYASLFLRFSQDKEAKYTLILERLEQSDDEESSNISDLDI